MNKTHFGPISWAWTNRIIKKNLEASLYEPQRAILNICHISIECSAKHNKIKSWPFWHSFLCNHDVNSFSQLLCVAQTRTLNSIVQANQELKKIEIREQRLESKCFYAHVFIDTTGACNCSWDFAPGKVENKVLMYGNDLRTDRTMVWLNYVMHFTYYNRTELTWSLIFMITSYNEDVKWLKPNWFRWEC